MIDDIVERLRKSTWRDCIEAADEIERLRRNTGCARNQGTTQFCAEALDAQREVETLREQLRLANIDCFNTTAEVDQNRDELVRNADEFRETLTELRQRVETLRAERDEARREVCARFALIYSMTVQDVEKLRGWDCFKENQ